MGGVADRGDDQVAQGLGVLGIARGGLDGDRDHLTGAGHRHLDQVTAGGAGHRPGGQLVLRGGQLGLHRLSLRHQALQVESTRIEHDVSFVTGPAHATGRE